MNQKIFHPLICGASISEQHLQTELCQDKWYQLGIKTLNKIKKHWSELNKLNECISMQQSVEGMVQDWIGQKKKTILATVTISYLFLLK